MFTSAGKHVAWAVASLVGLLATSVAVLQVTLSFKFGTLELAQPSLALLVLAALGVAVVALQSVTSFTNLALPALGQAAVALLCLLALFVPGGAVPQVVTLHSPWAPILVAGVFIAIATLVLHRQLKPLPQGAVLLHVVAASSASTAVLFTLFGFLVWHYMFTVN